MIKLSNLVHQNVNEAKQMVVTKISDIPNLKSMVDKGMVSYRGLGIGKLYNDFYDLAGQGGVRIKVGKTEYFMTDSDFKKLGGISKIRFAAPARKY